MTTLQLGFRTRIFSRALADILRAAQRRDITVKAVVVDRIGFFEKYVYLELEGTLESIKDLDNLITEAPGYEKETK